MQQNNAIKQFMASPWVQTLIASKLISSKDVEVIAHRTQKTGKTFLLVLFQDKRFDSEGIFNFVCEDVRLPLIRDQEELRNQLQSSGWLTFKRAYEIGCVLLKSTPQRTYYGTVDPYNPIIHAWVKRCGGKPATKVLVHPNCFFNVVSHLKYFVRPPNDQHVKQTGQARVVYKIDFHFDQKEDFQQLVTARDVRKMVDYLLQLAYVRGASDLHIEPDEDGVVIRPRVDGILDEEMVLPVDLHSELVSRIKIISGMDISEKRRPQDGSFGVLIGKNALDLRVSSYPTTNGEKFVLRFLNKSAAMPSVNQLGMREREFRLMSDAISSPYGLVIISGPTGSGKTTTLYSCLSEIDTTSLNVMATIIVSATC